MRPVLPKGLWGALSLPLPQGVPKGHSEPIPPASDRGRPPLPGVPDTSTPLMTAGVPRISEVPLHLCSACEELGTVTSLADTTHPGGCLVFPKLPNSPKKALTLPGLSDSPKEMLTTLLL